MSLYESSPTQSVDDNEQYSLMLDPVVEASEDDGFTVSAITDDETVEDSSIEDSSAIIVEEQLNIKAESIWVSMPNGEQLHMRHLQPMPTDANPFEAESPKRVFMLHGEVECGRIFYHDSGKGLAYHFAQQGYEVFVADLGGRGRSLGCDDEPSSLTVHEIVTDAIPRLLRAATQHCSLSADESMDSAAYVKSTPVAPTVWVAHGFGGVLLSAAWARMSEAERTATQMMFFSVRRKLQTTHRIANAAVKAFCHPLTSKLVNWLGAFPAAQLRLGSADENTDWFSVYADWMNNDRWCDAEDGFDYQAALKANPIPATLHFATAADKIYSGAADVRAFINELGCHDARLIVANTIDNTKRKYDHLSLLLDPAAVKDVFKDATDWLLEQTAVNREAIADVDEPYFVDTFSESEQAVEKENFDLPFEYSSVDDELSSNNNDHSMALSLAG
jgi:alpha-beta hydrolase superfamily lysophospholipase